MDTKFSNNEIAEVLEKAADHIHINGHHKGWYSYGKATCAKGAIITVTGTPVEKIQKSYIFAEVASNNYSLVKHTFASLESFLPNNVNIGTASIAYWNDAPERTQEEVEEALKSCAKELRNNS